MEQYKEQFAQLLKQLRTQYNIFLLGLMVYVAINSYGIFSYQIVSDEVGVQLQSAAVLLTLLAIPAALKLFSRRLIKIAQIASMPLRIVAYKKSALIRLGTLFLAAILDITGYYLTKNYSFLLIAGMAVVGSIFCIPTENKIAFDLDTDSDSDTDEDDELESDNN